MRLQFLNQLKKAIKKKEYYKRYREKHRGIHNLRSVT